MGTIEGRYTKDESNDVFDYVATYSFSAIGITYRAEAGFGEARAPFVQGVIAWGIQAFPPKQRVREAVEETLSFTNPEKLKAKIAEQ